MRRGGKKLIIAKKSYTVLCFACMAMTHLDMSLCSVRKLPSVITKSMAYIWAVSLGDPWHGTNKGLEQKKVVRVVFN